MSKNSIVAGQEDIFSMFGIVDEYAEQQKREEEERKKKAEELRKKLENAKSTPSSKSEVKSKEDKFELNENTIIRYFGDSLEIQSYFSSEEIAEGILKKKKNGETERIKIDGEILRKRMENDFPELVKSMTEMVYIKDKNIVIPVMKAKKKGNCMGTSSVLTEGVSSPSLRIPFSILRDFISLARLYAEYHLEIHGDIYFDKGNNHFFLDVPGQNVHQFWCEVTESEYSIVSRVGDAKKVAEIHSHHHMSPIPSNQDNESEQGLGIIYCIVGRLDRFFPNITIRVFQGQGWIKLSPFQVFEDPFYTIPSYPSERIEVIVNE